MLIKKPTFPSVRDAISAIGMMTLSPYAKNVGDSLPNTVVEQSYRIEEFHVLDDRVASTVIAMWGEGDYFVVYQDGQGHLVIEDGVHRDDSDQQELDDDILQMLKRCMLVGYVPRALLQAINEYGRNGPPYDFVNIFGDCVDHVEDILEAMGA